MLKHKAIEMRKEGHTYKEIADYLCVKESWCKYHLKGVDTGANKYVEDMKKAGVAIGDKVVLTRWVAKGIIFKTHQNVSYDRSLYLLNKAKKFGIIVTPDCTNLNSPTASYTNLITYALELKCRVEEMIDEYISNLKEGEYEQPHRMSIQQELLKLSLGTREGTTNRVNRIESILIEVEALKELDFIKYNVQK